MQRNQRASIIVMGIIGTKFLQRGFTIVELLVVIVVIGILAGMVTIAYPNYQATTRDNQRKSDVQQVASALSAYMLKHDNYVETSSGCGYSGNGNGWLNASGTGSYPASIVSCLQNAEVLPGGEFIDPSKCRYAQDSAGRNCGTNGGGNTTAYMKASCEKNDEKITYVMARLEQQTPTSSADMDALCDPGSVGSLNRLWGSYYGMNYYRVVR